MKNIWFILYNTVFIPLFWLLLHIAAFFNNKVRRGIEGRRGLLKKIDHDISKLTSKRRVWFHSSSMGEFEQAKPIIAALRKKYHDINIIVTFFSPSGYDHSKNYKLADIITYIPFDSKANAHQFLNLLQPTAAVFVRYDVWPNHLWELKMCKIYKNRCFNSKFWECCKCKSHNIYKDKFCWKCLFINCFKVGK